MLLLLWVSLLFKTAVASGLEGLHDLQFNYGDEYAPKYDNYQPRDYQFDYFVSDPHTGDHKSQWEVKIKGVVRGGYSLLEPDGTTRVVEYVADDHGFRALVKKIGIAIHPETHHIPHTEDVVVPIHHAYDGNIQNYANVLPLSVGQLDAVSHTGVTGNGDELQTNAIPEGALAHNPISQQITTVIEPSRAPNIYVEPVWAPQIHVEPIKTPGIYVEPHEAPQIYVEPVKAPQVYVEPIKPPQIYVEPVKAPQAYAEPINTQPIYAEPIKSQQFYTEPIKTPQNVVPVKKYKITLGPWISLLKKYIDWKGTISQPKVQLPVIPLQAPKKTGLSLGELVNLPKYIPTQEQVIPQNIPHLGLNAQEAPSLSSSYYYGITGNPYDDCAYSKDQGNLNGW